MNILKAPNAHFKNSLIIEIYKLTVIFGGFSI